MWGNKHQKVSSLFLIECAQVLKHGLIVKTNPISCLIILATRLSDWSRHLQLIRIKIRLNHLELKSSGRPVERFFTQRSFIGYFIAWQVQWWTLFWTQFKRRLTGRVNLAALMHYQSHDYIIDYFGKSIENRSFSVSCGIYEVYR